MLGLQGCTCLPDHCRGCFLMVWMTAHTVGPNINTVLQMWLWFWYFTPVMYLVVVSMVHAWPTECANCAITVCVPQIFSELDFWSGLGGLSITWIVFLCIGLVMQCAKCAWFTGLAMKNASSQHWVNDRGSSSSTYQSVPVLDYGSVENPIVGAPVVGQPMYNTHAHSAL